MLEDQIADMGPHSAPSTLLLYPSRPFSFTFARRTFRVPGDEEGSATSPLNYYAVSADNAPLPSWISFDAATLTFSGTAPPFGSLVQPPQTFGFQLVASDVVGFTSAVVPFSIVIGNHELTADKTLLRLNATRGDPFEYAGLRGMLKIDGKRLVDGQEGSDTNATAMGVPNWLEFDEETWALAGTPEADAKSANVTLTIADKYADNLNVTLVIEVEDADVFVSDLPDVNVTAGTDLSFDLKRYLFDPAKVDVSVTSRPKASWLHLDPVSKKLSGTAPELDAKGYASEFTVAFKATPRKKRSRSDSSSSRDTRTMHLRLTDPAAPTHPTSTPTPPPSPSPKPEEPAENDTSRRKLLWLLLPFLLLVCIALIFLLLWLRRRRRRAESDKIMEVSAPIPGTFVNHNAWPGASDIRGMVDIGPSGEQSQQRLGGYTSPQPQYPRNASDPPSSLPPHALSIYTDRRKSRSESALLTAATANPPRGSWLTRWPQPLSGRAGATPDGRSLLSDTSLGSGDDIHQHSMEAVLPSLARAKTRAPTTKHDDGINNPGGRGSHPYTAENRPLQLLELPLISDEPFSIQPTPEMAYQPPQESAEGRGDKYDFISSSSGGSSPRGEAYSDFLSTTSSEQLTPVVGYVRRGSGRQSSSHNHSGRPRSSGLGLGIRLSRVLKRSPSTNGSPRSRGPRDSHMSSSTGQTTRTSILTTAIAEQAQIRARAGNTASVVARPTIVHIPSRPGEARQASRMASGGLQPSGNQIDDRYSNTDTNSNNNDTNANTNNISSSRDPGEEESLHRGNLSPPPRIYVVEAGHRDSDSSWDRLARDSLGIAHKDLGADFAAPARAPIHTHAQKQDHQEYGGGFADAAARPRRLFSTSPDMNEEDEPNWKPHHRQDLIAPDQWSAAQALHPQTTTAPSADYPTPALTYQTGTTPSPATGSLGGDNEDGDGGMATPMGTFGLGTDMDALVGARSSWTKPLRIPGPETPPSRDRGAGAGETNYASETTTASTSLYQTPASRPPTHRRQAPISQTTPSPPPLVPLPLPQLPPDAQAAVSTRPLPETPTPAGRGVRSPLTDRLNEATPTAQTPARAARRNRSVGSVRSRKSSRRHGGGGELGGNQSDVGGADGNDDDDDIWEDIRPPESTFGGGWEDGGGDSDGSFAVYI